MHCSQLNFFLLDMSACVSWDYHHLRRNYCIGCIWNTFLLNVSVCVSWGWHNLWRNNCIGCIWKASWHYELAFDVSDCQHLQSRTGCSCEASVKHALGSLNLLPCRLWKFWCFALLKVGSTWKVEGLLHKLKVQCVLGLAKSRYVYSKMQPFPLIPISASQNPKIQRMFSCKLGKLGCSALSLPSFEFRSNRN